MGPGARAAVGNHTNGPRVLHAMTNSKHLIPTLVVLLVAVTAAFAWGPLTRHKNALPLPPAATPHATLGALPVDEWLNTAAPITPGALRGDVVLIEFWTFLCYNCRNVQPWMKEVHARYAANASSTAAGNGSSGPIR